MKAKDEERNHQHAASLSLYITDQMAGFVSMNGWYKKAFFDYQPGIIKLGKPFHTGDEWE